MKQITSTKKYYLLKGLLILSFYTIGRWLIMEAENGFFEEIAYIFVIGYIILFNVLSFLLVRYAYKQNLKKVLWISLFYNGFMANIFPFALLDYILSHSGEPFSDYTRIIFAAVPDDTLGFILYMALTLLVFIANIVALVKLSKKEKQEVIVTTQPKSMVDITFKEESIISIIIDEVKKCPQLYAKADSSELAESCNLKFIISSDKSFDLKTLYSYNKALKVAFVYKESRLDRLEFYYHYQLCKVEQL